jgi:titin
VWTAPVSNGGAAITDYRVQYSSNGGTSWTRFADGTSTATSATVTGLTNGTAYVFQVRAVNAAGLGGFGKSAAVTPRTTAAAPTGMIGTAGDTQVSLVWTAPVSDGGATITDYRVQYSSNGGTTWTRFADGTSTATSATVTGLTNGTAYVFQVRAVNAAGLGAFGQSAAVTPLPLAAAPTRLTGRAGDGSVALAWTAPADTGGLPIVNYVVQYSTNYSGNVNTASWTKTTSGSNQSRVTVAVPRGITYVFRVAAVTAGGEGALSAVSPALTPF